MGKQDKLIKKAKNNSGGLHFDEFVNLLRRHNWILDRQKDSHQIWISPEKHRLPIQGKNGIAKKYQAEQFLSLLKFEEQEDA